MILVYKGGIIIKIAAVVVTYNRKKLLAQTLDALHKQSYRVDRIYVIDNASTDGTADMVSISYPSVNLIKLPTNRGGSGGFSLGLRLAVNNGYDWVWLMDDDAVPTDVALDNLVTSYKILSLKGHSDIGVLQSSVCIPGESQDFYWGVLRLNIDWRHIIKSGYVTPIRISGHDSILSVDFCPFVGFLVSSKAVKRVGLPDENYFLYGDDWDYCLRLKGNGFSLWLVATSVIHHHVGHKKKIVNQFGRLRAKPIGPPWRTYYSIRNHIALIIRNQVVFGDVAKLVLLKHLIGVLKGAIATLLFWDRPVFLRMWYITKGTVDGLFCRLGKRVNPS